MTQLFEAIDFCHNHNIIHRDLKPENIMLIKKEINSIKDYQIKLIDFGNSVINNNKGIFKNIVGTPFYVAPEVLEGKGDSKCDLWGLGVIMYILLYGIPPFNGRSDEEICENVSKGEFIFIDEIKKNNRYGRISKDAKDLIRKLLNKDVNARYSAADALKHPWITSFETTLVGNENFTQLGENKNKLAALENETLNNLKNFRVSQKFTQLSLALLAHNFADDEEIEKLRTIFKEFDENGDGHLSREELTKGLMRVMDKEDAEKETQRIMNLVDTDGNGTIEFSEFFNATADKRKLIQKDKLKVVFKLLDDNGDGQLSCQELQALFKDEKSEIAIQEDLWQQLMAEADTDGDNLLSFDEFCQLMEGILLEKKKSRKLKESIYSSKRDKKE